NPTILDRLQVFWTRRIEIACNEEVPTSRTTELSRFGWWFVSKKFNDDWAVAQLREVLQLTRQIEPGHLVVRQLAEIADTRPKIAIECLELMIEGDTKGWSINLWRES